MPAVHAPSWPRTPCACSDSVPTTRPRFACSTGERSPAADPRAVAEPSLQDLLLPPTTARGPPRGEPAPRGTTLALPARSVRRGSVPAGGESMEALARKHDVQGRLSRSLGWFSIGLGLAEVTA